MTENKINLPLVIELDEAKRELTQCINNLIQGRNLPCYLIEPMLADVYTQIQIGAKSELAAARSQINKTDEGMA